MLAYGRKTSDEARPLLVVLGLGAGPLGGTTKGLFVHCWAQAQDLHGGTASQGELCERKSSVEALQAGVQARE